MYKNLKMFLKRNNGVGGRSLLAHQSSLRSASHLSACSRFLGKHPCFPFWPSFSLQWHMLSVPCPPLAWRASELEWHHLCSCRAHFQFLTNFSSLPPPLHLKPMVLIWGFGSAFPGHHQCWLGHPSGSRHWPGHPRSLVSPSWPVIQLNMARRQPLLHVEGFLLSYSITIHIYINNNT